MNIGIISRPRTVSTAVINTLEKKYHLTNEFEDYHVLVTSLLGDNKKLKNLEDSAKQEYFENALLAKTNEFFSNGNFVCKIWPCMFMRSPVIMLPNWSMDYIKSRTAFDITRLFNIDKYDQLYFIDRDVYTTTASWIYSRKINVFHTHRSKKHSTPIINLNTMDYAYAKFHVLEYVLQQKLKQLLIEKQIPFVDISNNYNDYIDESLLTTKKSEHDYPSLITDYEKLHNSITEWCEFFTESTKDWKFT
jgi:hypothetical protein